MANLLKYKGYHANIEFSDEDNMLVGSVIGIQDSLNFHGNSVSEITQSFHDCIDSYLEMCKLYGRSPDKVCKGSLNIRIPQELHRKAAIMAETEGISLNQFIQKAIEDRVKPDQYKNKVVCLPTTQKWTTVESKYNALRVNNRYQSNPSSNYYS